MNQTDFHEDEVAQLARTSGLGVLGSIPTEDDVKRNNNKSRVLLLNLNWPWFIRATELLIADPARCEMNSRVE